MKRKFLAVYDYGTGGCWRFILARNKEEIIQKFPELIIFDYEKPPEWMQRELFNEIESEGISDIDDAYDKWLNIYSRN